MLFLFYKPLSAVLLSLVLLLAAFAPACNQGPLSRLDSTLDFAPLFFQGLVLSKVIDQPQADRYKQGVTRFEQIADTTKTCLSEDVKTDAQCYSELGVSARGAVAEFFPSTGSGKISEWSALILDIVNLIIQKNSPSVGRGVSDPEVIEQELNKKIDALDRLQKSEVAN